MNTFQTSNFQMNLIDPFQMIYIGTTGYVVCLNQATGQEVWRTPIPSRLANFITLHSQDRRIYCGGTGEVTILCSFTGIFKSEYSKMI